MAVAVGDILGDEFVVTGVLGPFQMDKGRERDLPCRAYTHASCVDDGGEVHLLRYRRAAESRYSEKGQPVTCERDPRFWVACVH